MWWTKVEPGILGHAVAGCPASCQSCSCHPQHPRLLTFIALTLTEGCLLLWRSGETYQRWDEWWLLTTIGAAGRSQKTAGCWKVARLVGALNTSPCSSSSVSPEQPSAVSRLAIDPLEKPLVFPRSVEASCDRFAFRKAKRCWLTSHLGFYGRPKTPEENQAEPPPNHQVAWMQLAEFRPLVTHNLSSLHQVA